MIEEILNPGVQQFIRSHAKDNVEQIALKYGKKKDFPLKAALLQIKARQRAKQKLPQWCKHDSIVFPSLVAVEQASSQPTAEFKANLFSGGTMFDLTGGLGADSLAFADRFSRVIYLEKERLLAECARHNFQVLGKNNIVIEHAGAEKFLLEKKSEDKPDLIYVDPDRRAGSSRKSFRFEESEPDIVKLLPTFKKHAENILIKTSPLMDIREAHRSLSSVSHTWVIGLDNEVKEVLYKFSPETVSGIPITCIDLSDHRQTWRFDFDLEEESQMRAELSSPREYLYEPGATILKAGAFRSVGIAFGLFKLNESSHLFTSSECVPEFPGRIFSVKKVLNSLRKDISQILPDMKANVISRNHPLSVARIREKTGLREGGEDYFIATRGIEGKPVYVVARRSD